jgi:hypothetical protein
MGVHSNLLCSLAKFAQEKTFCVFYVKRQKNVSWKPILKHKNCRFYPCHKNVVSTRFLCADIECVDVPLDIFLEFLNIFKYNFYAMGASTPMSQSEYWALKFCVHCDGPHGVHIEIQDFDKEIRYRHSSPCSPFTRLLWLLMMKLGMACYKMGATKIHPKNISLCG